MRPELGLIVQEPYATYIVLGKKNWEIRRYPTHIRGRIGIVSPRGWIGTAVLAEVRGPVSVEALRHQRSRHRADPEFLEAYARGRPLYIWVFTDPQAFPEPIPISRPRGPVVWIRLEEPPSRRARRARP
jgi:hypothetical protein